MRMIFPVLFALAASPATAQDLESNVQRALGLTGSSVQKLDPLGTPATGVQVQVWLDGQPALLDLEKHSVRAPGFELIEHRADGSMVAVDPGPVVTLRGSLEGTPEARVAGGLLESGFHARVMMPDGREFWIQPVPRGLGASPEHHVVYERAQILRTSQSCGADLLANTHRVPTPSLAGGGASTAGSTLYTAELGIDADYEYYQDYGSSTTTASNRIQTVINTMNLQYESEVSIRHTITATLVRTSSNQPYTSSDASTLLTQFRNEWNSNQGSIQRDVAQLFSGKSIIGGTIGIAWLGAVCTSFGYGMVESDFNNNFASATDLSAHELGHNWDADHCSCTSFTMNPFITSANTFSPTATRPDITSFRNSRSCLSTGGGGGGGGGLSNDDCASAEVITAGSTSFNTSNATSSGVSWTCAGGGGPDAWYSYTAPTSVDLTIDTCGSQYDTALQVFSGSCGSLSQIGCNDDACNLQSSLSITGLAGGSTILIRVGGYSGSTGAGTLTVTETSTQGPGQTSNPTPSNGAGSVSVDQVLSWGAGAGATSYDVYLGTSSALGGGDFRGSQSGTSFDPGTLAYSTTYYWRIDSSNGNGTTQGNVWSFTTESQPPGGVPNDECSSATVVGLGATAYDTSNATLSSPSWSCAGSGAPDIWYSYTAGSTADLRIETCGSGYDTALELYVDTCSNFLFCNDDSCGLQSEINVTGIPAGTEFLIRVGGWNNSTGAGVLTITETSSPPPGAPGNPSPATGATGVDVDENLSWSAASGATSYDVYFGTDPTPDGSEFQLSQSGTSFDPGVLANSTTYYWRIDAVNAAGTTQGPVWSFTTEDPAGPGVATNPIPSDGATGVSVNQDLSWTSGANTSTFDVWLGTSPSLGLFLGDFLGNQTGTTRDVGTLQYSTTYYWRIDSLGPGGTTIGAVWSFTTEDQLPPGVATDPVPTDGATGVSVDQDLGWTAGGNTSSFDVWLGTDPNLGLFLGDFLGNQTGTTRDVGTLQYSTTYYWRIDSLGPGGTTFGTVWSFTTEDPPPPTETLLFRDNFDSGSLARGWTSPYLRRIRFRSGSGISGLFARIRRAQYIEVTVDASAYTGLRLESARRARNMDPGESFQILVNGTAVETLTGSTAWVTSDIDLSAYAGQSAVTIRFQSNGSALSESGDIDLIRVIGLN